MDTEDIPDEALPEILKELKVKTSIQDKESVKNTLNTVLTLMAKKTAKLLKADGCIIEIAEDNFLVYGTVYGIDSIFLGLRIEKERSFSGTVISKELSLCCEDTEKDDRVNLEVCRRTSVRSMIVSPITGTYETGNKKVGVIKSIFKQPKQFSPLEVLQNENMASLVGMAISNAIGIVEIETWAKDIINLFKQTQIPVIKFMSNDALLEEMIHCGNPYNLPFDPESSWYAHHVESELVNRLRQAKFLKD